MTRDLNGKVIVITGASAGIGAAAALECARAGMDVVLNARRAEPLETVARQVNDAGRAAELVVGDAAEPGFEDRLLDAATQRFGHFDVVLANAGYGINRAMHELDEQALRDIFEVNFFAPTRLLRVAARRLIAQRRTGHLLMTSSAVAKFTMPNTAAYSATKAAQNHVCRAMRLELRPYHIEVSSVHPITTRTEFFDVAARHSGVTAESHLEETPGWLVQTPEQVARAIVNCLRRPVPEVWTSYTVRTIAGLATIFPPLADMLVGSRRAQRHGGATPAPAGAV